MVERLEYVRDSLQETIAVTGMRQYSPRRLFGTKDDGRTAIPLRMQC